MSELLERSARLVDGTTAAPVSEINPVTGELHELADGVAMVAAFSHVVALSDGGGPPVLFDVSLAPFGSVAQRAIRAWRDQPVDTVVYTHGHVDHVGGMPAFLDAADERGEARPRVIGHANVPARFERYERTHGYNQVINQRQFGRRGLGSSADGGVGFPRQLVPPDVTYVERLDLTAGDLDVQLHHGFGETDDHTWAWVPGHRAVVAGDFLIWMFPNAGNPQKVQRYPREWALALREMAELEPELLLPAHGLPIEGRARVARVLDETATALEGLVGDTLALMNQGAPLDQIIHEVRVDPALLERPYLQPLYDEPEFVVRNIWRLYGGWYDGTPSRLKPPPDAAVAHETAALAGGAAVLAERATELAEAGDLRLACHFADLAAAAAPDDASVHARRADVYARRRHTESSLMAKGIFRDAEERSRAVAEAAGGERPAPGAP